MGAGVQHQCVEVRHIQHWRYCIRLFPPAVCPDLSVLVNGIIIYNPASTLRLQGAMATHFCTVTGYQLSSSTTTRTCQSDRMWSGSSLTCQSELYWPFKVLFYTQWYSCGLWQSSGDLEWNEPIFCHYIWRDCHLYVQWNLCSIRKLHYLYG